MRPNLRTDDQIFVNDATSRSWFKAGIPREYWKPISEGNQSFEKFPILRGPVVSAIHQRQAYRSLLKELRRSHPLVVIYSQPTDSGALVAAYKLFSTYLALGLRVGQVDLGFGVKPFRKNLDVLLLHNIMTNSPPDRIQLARDTILKHRYSFKIAVVGGVPKNPRNWWNETVRYGCAHCFVVKDLS